VKIVIAIPNSKDGITLRFVKQIAEGATFHFGVNVSDIVTSELLVHDLGDGITVVKRSEKSVLLDGAGIIYRAGEFDIEARSFVISLEVRDGRTVNVISID
jgi:hypothetical protein